jgi:hypothetical protein
MGSRDEYNVPMFTVRPDYLRDPDQLVTLKVLEFVDQVTSVLSERTFTRTDSELLRPVGRPFPWACAAGVAGVTLFIGVLQCS